MERCKIEISTKIAKTLKRKTYRAGARSRCETVPGIEMQGFETLEEAVKFMSAWLNLVEVAC